MSKAQTDNSYFFIKTKLRQDTLPDKDKINVLDVFSGDGLIWKYIKANTEKQIKVLRMDQKNDKKGVYLSGDNRKFITSIDLTKFDVIDFDAYGVPYKQLELIKNKIPVGTTLYFTFIQTIFGILNKNLLIANGFSAPMIKKCPTLLMKNGINLFLNYLYTIGCRKVKIYSFGRKHYIYSKKESNAI